MGLCMPAQALQFSSVQSLSRVRIAAHQASVSITNSLSLLRLMSFESVMPSNHLILVPFSSCLQSCPASGSFAMSQLFPWPKYWCFSFSISPSNGRVGSPCSPTDSQKSSPTPQFKSINSLGLSLLYGPALTSIHDCWRNNSLD